MTKQKLRMSALTLALTIAFGLAPVRGTSVAAESLVIKGGRLIDGAGRAPMENAVIVVEGDKIKAVFGQGGGRIPGGVKVLDATGKTIMPGLIDVHVHLGGSAGTGASPEEYSPARQLHDLKAYLYSGVTTIKSLGDTKDQMIELRRQERAGSLPAPRIVTVGKGFTAPGGHPVSTVFAGAPQFVVEMNVNQVETESQARAAVKALAADQVDGIKAIYEGGSSTRPLPKLKLEVLQAIIDEAHRAKLKVSVHCSTAQDVKDVVLAGADGIEHGDQEGLEDQTLKLMAERGVFYSPTLAVLEAFLNIAKGTVAADDPLVRAAVAPAVLEGLTQPSASAAPRFKPNPTAASRSQIRLDAAKTNVRRALAVGVKIVTGTDSGNPATFHGPAMHRELALLVEAGLSPMQAITAATQNAAAYVGAQDRVGTIEAGKLADLLIVDGDPLKDISATKKIWRVIKGGKEVDRETLLVEIPPEKLARSTAALPAIVDDFEDGNDVSWWGGQWTAIDDRVAGGSSQAKIGVASGGARGSKQALRVSGQVTTKFAYGPFAGANLSLGKDQTPFDVGQYRGIQFYIRASGKQYRLTVHTAAVKDYDDFSAVFTAESEWKLIQIPFADLKQQGFGKRVEWNAQLVTGITVYTVGAPQDNFEFFLDDVSFYK